MNETCIYPRRPEKKETISRSKKIVQTRKRTFDGKWIFHYSNGLTLEHHWSEKTQFVKPTSFTIMTKRWNSDTGRSPSDCGDIFQQKNLDGWVVVRNQIEYIVQYNSEK